MGIVDVLKLISDQNRLRILNILYRREKICVCVLEDILELNQSNLSRHLNKLKKAKIIIGEKRSQWVDYSISHEFLDSHRFLKEILDERMDEDLFIEDLNKVRCIDC